MSESYNRLPISYAAFILFGSSNIDDDVVFRVCKFGIWYNLGVLWWEVIVDYT